LSVHYPIFQILRFETLLQDFEFKCRICWSSYTCQARMFVWTI